MKHKFIPPFLIFASGVIFSLGLGFSGMMHPGNIHDFLVIGPDWNPALILVLGIAVIVHMVLRNLSVKYFKRPVFGESYSAPSSSKIDRNLVIGATIFGAGWGLSGLCPGPVLANLVTLNPLILMFLGAMILGMLTKKLIA